MKYRSEIDGLRAIAILPVVFFHAGFSQFSGGYVGVDVFFVISGFLITRILTDELHARHFSIIRFYERRARRILPALFFMVLLCVPAAWVLLPPSEMQKFSDSLVSVAVFSSNILFWQQSGYFDTAAELKPLLHTWSLAVEEQYYIAFPALLLFAHRIGPRVVLPMLMVLFFLSLCLAVMLVNLKPNASFFLLPTRGWELLLGALCTLYHPKHVAIPTSLANALSAVGLAMIVVAVFTFDRSTPTPSIYTLIPTFGAALVLLYAGKGTRTGAILGSQPLVVIGLLSYSAYLWHQPVFVFLRYASQGPIDLAWIWMAILAIGCLSYMSWRYVETPFRDRQKISIKSVAIFGVLGTTMVGAFGVVGHLSNGFQGLRETSPVFQRDVQIQQARAERQKLIRAGICHFDENLPISTFIKQWDCRSNDEGMFDSQVAVFGDSHAADKTVALRLNRVDVWQITGAGCEVAPNFVKDDRGYCLELFRLFETHRPEIKGVVLANRFAIHELTDEYVAAIFQYWGKTGVPVVLFAPMPDFELQQQEFAAKGVSTTPPSFERERKFLELIKNQKVPSNITILKASDYWCATGVCTVARNGEYMMTDEDHLSLRGADLFGRALLADRRVRILLGKDK